MYTLCGFHSREGFVEQYFTANEKATALAIAQIWAVKGMQPSLYSYETGVPTVIYTSRVNRNLRKVA